MSVCSKWSREYGCTRCRNRRECDELGLSPFDAATDEEVNALVDDGILPEYHRRGNDKVSGGTPSAEADGSHGGETCNS